MEKERKKEIQTITRPSENFVHDTTAAAAGASGVTTRVTVCETADNEHCVCVCVWPAHSAETHVTQPLVQQHGHIR